MTQCTVDAVYLVDDLDNLKYMAKFAKLFPDLEIVQASLAQSAYAGDDMAIETKETLQSINVGEMDEA